VVPVIVALLLLAICGLVACLIWRVSEPQVPPTDVDPETALRAAAELHGIRRRLDVAELQHEQRVAANRLRREIAEALETDHDAS
jgi:hypothetical protein